MMEGESDQSSVSNDSKQWGHWLCSLQPLPVSYNLAIHLSIDSIHYELDDDKICRSSGRKQAAEAGLGMLQPWAAVTLLPFDITRWDNQANKPLTENEEGRRHHKSICLYTVRALTHSNDDSIVSNGTLWPPSQQYPKS